MRLSDYFDHKDTPDILKEGNNFDALIRGLATQLEKNADSNVDREVHPIYIYLQIQIHICNIYIHIYILFILLFIFIYMCIYTYIFINIYINVTFIDQTSLRSKNI